jgi:hypothetical protein
VYDSLCAVRQKSLIEAIFIEEVPLDQSAGTYRGQGGGSVPAGKTVVYQNVVATVRQNASRMAADVAGTASDQDSHRYVSTVNW